METAAQTVRADLATRSDVEALLRRFYGQVLEDDILAEPFAKIRTMGLESHLPVMCDFWQTALFRAGLYTGSALLVHQVVHDQHALSAGHFLRWLTLWDSTINQMYQGPVAEHAKIQAARIARAMHRRLTRAESQELDALVWPPPPTWRRQSWGDAAPGELQRSRNAHPPPVSDPHFSRVSRP
ncbi:group III truncated hemoglobin [Mycolicibacterium sp.]|uniref:group III truncated hemoglobin n=1 Tax=Mycolicibacterium sp. TaxID=2320850 RepID=UPI0037C9C93E